MSEAPLKSEPTREGGPLALTQSRPVGVLMVTIAITVFGAISLRKLPVNLMPDFSYPTLTVRTEYPGTAPADVEERISRKIEQALAVTKGLRELHSVSRAGVSDVTLEFDWDTEMKFAAQDVRELLDQVVLPEDAEAPILLRYDPSQDPILRVAVYGPADLTRLRKLTEDEIQRELETVRGVAAVQVRGGLEPQIRIEVDEDALTARGMDIGFVAGRLMEENLNLASGELLEGETEYIVRTLTEFRDIEEIENLILEIRDDAVTRVRDIARVRRFHREREVITRVDGEECVLLDVYKEAESNLVRVAESVRTQLFGSEEQQAFAARLDERQRGDDADIDDAELSEKERKNLRRKRVREETRERAMLDFLRQKLPPEIELRLLADQSRFIKGSIREVRSAAVLGGLLAVLVLFLFLRNVRPTLIIATSIPVSIITTFAPMFMVDVSINIMSLGGLALGIGMLVDNSIVVLESITRFREAGATLGEAALRGVREVSSAVTASTLTTVSVFFPMVFVEGVAGQVFRDQALTVVFSLIVSLVVALFLIPMLASRRLPASSLDGDGMRSWFVKFQAPGVIAARLREARRRPLLWPVVAAHALLTFPVHLAFELAGRLLMLVVLTAVGTLLFLLRLFKWLGIQRLARILLDGFQVAFDAVQRLYPRILDGCLKRPIEVALGMAALTTLAILLLPRLGSELIPALHQGEFTAEVTLSAGTPLLENAEIIRELESRGRTVDGVADVFSIIGAEDDVVSDGDEGPHTARIVFRLVPTARPAVLEERVKNELYSRFRLPEIRTVRFRDPALFSFKTPIEVEIKNEDLDELKRDAAAVERLMADIPELRDVRSSIQRGNPEIRIRFDREKLIRFGLNQGRVQEILRGKIYGEVPTRFAEAESDKKIEIMVRVDERDMASLEDLQSIIINPGEERPRPLRDIAIFEEREGPSEIRHIGLSRGAIVSANLTGLDLASATSRIEEALDEVRRGNSTSSFEVGGQKREMDTSRASLQNALILAVFLVYLVMAALFESLIQPLLILVAIPLALLGVIPTLYLLEIPLSIVVLIGMIMLAGIVVNNAIVLIDSINRFRRQGLDRLEAIRRGGQVRFRPILMTTMTTVLGLIPLTGALGAIPGLNTLFTAIPGLTEWVSAAGGDGTEIRAPLAITVIAGLLASTLLTLIVIPVGYSVIARIERTRFATDPETDPAGAPGAEEAPA